MKVDITSLSHRSVARRLAVRLLFIPAAHLIFTGGDAIPHERQEREREEGIRVKCFGIGSMVRGQRQPCSGSGAQGVQGQPAGSIPTALTCDVTEGGGRAFCAASRGWGKSLGRRGVRYRVLLSLAVSHNRLTSLRESLVSLLRHFGGSPRWHHAGELSSDGNGAEWWGLLRPSTRMMSKCA